MRKSAGLSESGASKISTECIGSGFFQATVQVPGWVGTLVLGMSFTGAIRAVITRARAVSFRRYPNSPANSASGDDALRHSRVAGRHRNFQHAYERVFEDHLVTLSGAACTASNPVGETGLVLSIDSEMQDEEHW